MPRNVRLTLLCCNLADNTASVFRYAEPDQAVLIHCVRVYGDLDECDIIVTNHLALAIRCYRKSNEYHQRACVMRKMEDATLQSHLGCLDRVLFNLC